MCAQLCTATTGHRREGPGCHWLAPSQPHCTHWHARMIPSHSPSSCEALAPPCTRRFVEDPVEGLQMWSFSKLSEECLIYFFLIRRSVADPPHCHPHWSAFQSSPKSDQQVIVPATGQWPKPCCQRRGACSHCVLVQCQAPRTFLVLQILQRQLLRLGRSAHKVPSPQPRGDQPEDEHHRSLGSKQ